MNKIRFPDPGIAGRLAICAGYSVLVYLFLSETFVNAHDPSNFCLAVRHGWSIYQERPHAPGYPWFVVCFSVIAQIASVDEHHAILLFNALMSGVALYLFWTFSRKQFGSDYSIAVLLFATNPVVLYFAGSSEIYIYDAVFSIGMLMLVLWGKRKWFIPLMFILGVLGGFRFSSLTLLAPAFVLLWHWRRPAPFKSVLQQLVAGGIALAAGMCTWFLPYFIFPTGDLSIVTKAQANLGSLNATIYQQLIGFSTILLWVFNLSIVALFLPKRKPVRSTDPKFKPTILLWILFPVIFFSFVHYAKGYVLLILPVLIILVSERLIRSGRGHRWALIFTLVNLLLFFLVPFVETPIEASLVHEQRTTQERIKTTLLRFVSVDAPTFSHTRTTDAAMADALRLIKAHCPSGSSILFDMSSAYCYYPRALQVYLPNYDLVAARREPLVNLYSGAEVAYNLSLAQGLRSDELFYVIDARLPTILGEPPQSTFIDKGRFLAFYRTRITDTTAFMNYLLRIK